MDNGNSPPKVTWMSGHLLEIDSPTSIITTLILDRLLMSTLLVIQCMAAGPANFNTRISLVCPKTFSFRPTAI